MYRLYSICYLYRESLSVFLQRTEFLKCALSIIKYFLLLLSVFMLNINRNIYNII